MSEKENPQDFETKEKKPEKPGKMLMIVGIVFLVVFLLIYFSIEAISGKRQSGKQAKPSASSTETDSGGSGSLKEGESEDPVCHKAVVENSAPYHYDYLGKRFYFCSEDCLGKFINDPLKYSGAKVKIKVNMKVSPTPDESNPDAQSTDILAPYPSELPESGGSGGGETPAETFEPMDTPADNPGDGAAPPPDAKLPDSTGEAKPGKDAAAPKEPAAAPKEPAAAPAPAEKTPAKSKDAGSSGDAEPPAKSTKKSELPPGAEGKRTKPAKEADPSLKATPIKPPSKGTESI
ncbi:MAG: YHS domain-containing protein [Firmicutes bacterium]|nr:YHS domain-containing protein [Bacillota bacterium]